MLSLYHLHYIFIRHACNWYSKYGFTLTRSIRRIRKEADRGVTVFRYRVVQTVCQRICSFAPSAHCSAMLGCYTGQPGAHVVFCVVVGYSAAREFRFDWFTCFWLFSTIDSILSTDWRGTIDAIILLYYIILLPAGSADSSAGIVCSFVLTGRFLGFRPAGATRCTDQGEIWHEADQVRSSLPNFTLIGSGVWFYGPKNFKKIGILPI